MGSNEKLKWFNKRIEILYFIRELQEYEKAQYNVFMALFSHYEYDSEKLKIDELFADIHDKYDKLMAKKNSLFQHEYGKELFPSETYSYMNYFEEYATRIHALMHQSYKDVTEMDNKSAQENCVFIKEIIGLLYKLEENSSEVQLACMRHIELEQASLYETS